MANFNYKQAFIHVNIDVTKEMISYKEKTIPSHCVIGIGLGFTDIAKVAVGQALGGLIGGAIAQSGYNKGGSLNKKLSEIPKSNFAQMIITYNEEGERTTRARTSEASGSATAERSEPINKDDKQKVMRVPLNTNDETCVKMIEAVAKEYHDKFIGFGGLPVVEKTLNISHLAAIITIVVIIAIVVGFIIYGATSSGSY
ncbi:hypothetical protein HZA40_02605 [Candidatus Peregrinibacteria bacterium]|nr:hypothetical protein [Candidatus Peregrinibacteria bacterium]